MAMSEAADIMRDVEKGWDEITFKVKSVESKEDVMGAYQALLKFYSMIYSYKSMIGKGLRQFENSQSISDFESKSQRFVLKGFHFEERERLRNIALPGDIKDLYDCLAVISDYMDGAKRKEIILASMMQLFILDLKLSYAGH